MRPTKDRSTPPEPPRRGRPPGSVSLTDEVAATIVSLIRRGIFPWVAAEVAGVPRRTFRDWMARGEGTHLTRSCTPKLRRFYLEVTKARAEARAVEENRMFEEDPKHWLSRAARSSREWEGWSDPGRSVGEEDQSNTLAARLWEAERRDAEEEAAARCSDPSCSCASHQLGGHR